jgi:hypothetical protein
MSDASDAFAKQVIDAYEAIKGKLSGIHILDIPQAFADFVKIAERLALDAGGVSGQDKRDAVVKIIDDLIKLPFYLELLDGLVIGIIIDRIISALNKKFGHSWIDAAPPVTP